MKIKSFRLLNASDQNFGGTLGTVIIINNIKQ
jgi:hypothetical protein